MPKDKLAQAKDVLSKANAFSKSMPKINAGQPMTTASNTQALHAATPKPAGSSMAEQNAKAAAAFAASQGAAGAVGHVGVMHKGGPVKKTGLYLLEKGEHVLTQEEASEPELKVKIKMRGNAAKKFVNSGRVDPASELLNSVGSNSNTGALRSRSVKRNSYYDDDGGVNKQFKLPSDRMPMENTGPNPATSQQQQKLMAIAEHNPSAVYAKNRGVLKMSHEQLHDFAATKRKGLPKRVKKSK